MIIWAEKILVKFITDQFLGDIAKTENNEL